MRILHKLSLSFALVLLLLGASTGLLYWRSLHDILIHDLELKGGNLAANLAGLSQELIQTGNLYALYELVFLIKRNNSEVRYVLVMNSRGQVMVHTFSNGFPYHLLAQNPIPATRTSLSQNVAFQSNEGKIHDVLYPIEQGELGFVRIGLRDEQVQTILLAHMKKLAGIGGLIGVLTLMLVVWLTGHLTRPLQNLTRIAESIAQGRLPQTVSIATKDEIGRLGSSINIMLRHLREHEKEEQRLLECLFVAQENERKRISRELHDETSQALSALMLTLRAAANQMKDAKAQQQLIHFRDQLADVLEHLRHLAVELRPPVLDDIGLVATIEKYISDFQQRYAIKVQFIHTHKPGFSLSTSERLLSTELALFRIVQESLTNVARHAKASQACVELHEAQNTVLIIKDNGVGMPSEVLQHARNKNRLGLYGIQERVDILHGHFELRAEPPDWSSVIHITLPLIRHHD